MYIKRNGSCKIQIFVIIKIYFISTYLTIDSITPMHPLRNWALKFHEYLSDGLEPTKGEVIPQIKVVQ